MASSLLSSLTPVEPPSHLLEQILRAIESARLRVLYTRMVAVFSGLVLVTGYAALNWSSLQAEISTSPFAEFIRLAFSDPDIALANIKDVLLGLLESLPADFLFTLLMGATLAVGFVYLLQITHSIRHQNTSPLTTHLF
jgi:hypothetical protein